MAPAVPEIHTLRKKGRPVSIGPKTCNTGYTGGPYILFQTLALTLPTMRASACVAAQLQPLSELHSITTKFLYGLGSSNSFDSHPANTALALGILLPAAFAATVPVPRLTTLPWKFTAAHQTIATLRYTSAPRKLSIACRGTRVSHKLTRLVNQNFLQAPNPSFSAVYIPTSDLNANYNTRLRRQFSHGLLFDLQYRYAKSIDQLSNEGPGSSTNQADPAHPQTHALRTTTSSINVSVFALWNVPIFRDRSRFVGKI